MLVNLSQTVAESQQQNYAGIYNLVMMDLTITVFCEGNFGGSNCTQCAPGFTGTNCEITLITAHPIFVVKWVNVLMELTAFNVTVSLALLERFVRLTLMTVWGWTVAETEYVWMDPE